MSVSWADKRLLNLGRPGASFGFEFQFGSEIRHWASFTWFQVSLEKGEMDEEMQVAVRRQLPWKTWGCEQQRHRERAHIANRKAPSGEEHPYPWVEDAVAAAANRDTQKLGSTKWFWWSLAKRLSIRDLSKWWRDKPLHPIAYQKAQPDSTDFPTNIVYPAAPFQKKLWDDKVFVW